MNPYITLAELRSELKAVNTTDDAKVMENVRQASARLDRDLYQRRPLFVPYVETRQFRASPDRINSYDNTFSFEGYLLALTGLTVGGQTLTPVTNAEIWPSLQWPVHILRLTDLGTNWYSYCSSSQAPVLVEIAGIWGFNRDYPNAWDSVDTLAAAILTTTANTFTVADVDGANSWGVTPRISAGNLIRIDSEFMEVLATNVGTNTVTVKRGVNGSTAATHLISTAVEVWQVEETVKRAMQRQAAFMYARRGSYESANVTDLGIIQFPADILAEVRGMMQGLAYG